MFYSKWFASSRTASYRKIPKPKAALCKSPLQEDTNTALNFQNTSTKYKLCNFKSDQLDLAVHEAANEKKLIEYENKILSEMTENKRT